MATPVTGRTAVTAPLDDEPQAPRRLDQAAVAELYRLHAPYLLRELVRVTGGDRGKAEDILQETLVRAWNHPQVISRGLLESRPWLFTVARRIAIDHYRAQASRAQEVGEEGVEAHGLVMDPVDGILLARDIEVALAELPSHHRDVLVELHLKDRSVVDTARILGIPAGTVKSRNFHAIRAMRTVLKSQGMAISA
jgi:RNA polymerase sigma-70 factor, ECF subfamily